MGVAKRKLFLNTSWESCQEEVARLSEKLKDAHGEVVVGVGGEGGGHGKGDRLTWESCCGHPRPSHHRCSDKRIVAIYDQRTTWLSVEDGENRMRWLWIRPFVRAPVRFLVGMGMPVNEAEARRASTTPLIFKGKSARPL
jgi:hypothetical protein